MTRLLALCVTLAAGPAWAADGPVVVRVVTPDGKPAAGAKVWPHNFPIPEVPPPEPTPLVADAAGKVIVPAPVGRAALQLFARDAAGRVGSLELRERLGEPDDGPGAQLTLIDTAPRKGRVTAAGRPVVAATVTVSYYLVEDRGDRPAGGPAQFVFLPAWESARLAATTDTDGRFAVPSPVAGYGVSYSVNAAGFGKSGWHASAGADLDTPLVAPGSVTIAVAGIDVKLLKGQPWQLAASDKAHGPGVRQSRWKSGRLTGEPTVTVPEVVPGTYALTIEDGKLFPGVFEKPPAFEVTSGQAATVAAKFGPATTVTGSVTDKDGKGVAGVTLVIKAGYGANPQPQTNLYVTTDASGAYAAHGPAGWYTAYLQAVPDGFATPAVVGRRQLVEPAKVETGKSHSFAPIRLVTAATFAGRVVLADGTPAAGVSFGSGDSMFQGYAAVRADKDGRFTIPNLPPDDAVAPRVRSGGAVNVPETYELDKVAGPVTIELSEANAAAFTGRVVDAGGKPVAGAKVGLRHHIQGVGRQSQYGTVLMTATTKTDAEGRYRFTSLWPGDRYHPTISGVGYGEAEAAQARGEPGKSHDFGDTKLARTDLAARGTVFGPDGKPAAGAEVFSVDGSKPVATRSAADGSFTLNGVPEGGGFVFARAAGTKLAVAFASPGDAKPLTLRLSKADGLPVPPPEVPAAHRYALDAFTRHALTLVWDDRVASGYGSKAIADMARFDPVTAKTWRDEEKARTSGKTDYSGTLNRAERQKKLVETAKTDIDDAVAVVSALKAEAGFDEAMRVGEALLSVDKTKALRFAEEAVVKARQLEVPQRIWSMARAGDLAVRAGGVAGGKKVLGEAADLAAKLTPDVNGRNGLAVGSVATAFAAHDWPRAAALLDLLKDPGDYNRFLSTAAARVARTDLPRAKLLLDRFKAANSSAPHQARLGVACAVAVAQPDEAVALVAGVQDRWYRSLGYVRLATLFAAADPARSAKMIDAAFDLLEAEPDAFRSYSNFGGRAAVAAVAAVRAKEAGYPDVPHLVARALAMRSTGADTWSPEGREDHAVSFAGVLSLIDPAAARYVLATLGSPDELIKKAATKRRDWLFALAFADPQRATALADTLVKQSKAARLGGNAASGTGLVELGSILTAPDRLAELSRWGNLPLRILEDD